MSHKEEIEELLSAKREWDGIEQALASLRASGFIYSGQNLTAEFKAQLIVAARDGEAVDLAIGRLRPDLIATRSTAAPAGKSGCMGVFCGVLLLVSLACFAALSR